MGSYDILFEPVSIGPVTAPNRFFAVPQATGHGWSQPNGAIALRGMKAEGGWGTVAVQITEISPDADMANHPMERIWDDGDIPRHAAQVEAIRRHGSLAAIELGHGGARSRNLTTAVPVIGPSALPVLRPEVPVQAKAMDRADIINFRQAHKNAAQRAKQAGYDILYVYAAHDLSILSHFLSLNTNRRTDEYGGSLDNRIRLLREVLQDTLEIAAGDVAVALRFSVAEPGKKGGITHDGEGRDVVEALAELPDLWDVNLSGWPHDSNTARFADQGFQLPYTDFVKSLTTKPVVGVGRFTSPDMMVSLVRKGKLDLIGAARPSIADPFLPNKIKQRRIEDIRECIGCNICVSMDSYGLPIRCTQNPTISEEWQRGWHPETPALSQQRQSHLVVGAGPAGLECATTLMRAGQKVTLVDAAAEAGGRINTESRLPGFASLTRVRDYRLYQLSQSANADLYLSSPMTAEDIREFGADTITVATGAKWQGDGTGSSNFDPLDLGSMTVLTPEGLLIEGRAPDDASPIVVYDDDHFYMASALAEQLASAGHSVRYVTPLAQIATWTDLTLEQGKIIDRLVSLNVALSPNAKLEGGPKFTDTLTGQNLPFDLQTLVMVGMRQPRDQLYHDLIEMPSLGVVYCAGDCVTPGIIQAAVLSGHRIAREILDPEAASTALRRDQIDQFCQ